MEKFRVETVKIGDLLVEHWIPVAIAHDNPLLFVHGMHGRSSFFHNWARTAAEAGWEVWIINLRGHNGSRPVKNFGKVSIMDYVEDVEDVLRYFTSNRIRPPVLIGHSMGGLILQIVADRDRDRNPDIPAMILTNSAPGRGIFPGNRHTLPRYWKPPYLIASILKRPLQPQNRDMRHLVFNNMSPSAAEAAFQKTVPESGLVARELTFWCWCGPETKLYYPVLVIGATKDRLTPVSIQKKIARKYKAMSMYKEFPGAHALPIEEGWRAPIQFILKWAADHNL